MSPRPWLGYACAIASAVAFSWKAIFAKLAYRTGVDATTVLGLRMAFSLPAYLGLAWLGAHRKPRTLYARDWVRIAALGLVGFYLASYLDFYGLMRISAGLERLILFLYPSIVLMFAAWRARRRVSLREWQAIGLGYAGIACVFAGDAGRAAHGQVAWLGVLAVFASSIIYSGYLVYAESAVLEFGSLRFTGLAMSLACVVGVTQFALGSSSQPLPPRAIYICALMAAFSTVLPTLLLTEAVGRIGPGRAALCGMIGPVTTVGLEAALLGEVPSLADGIGTALVLGSVALLTRTKLPATPVEE